MPDRCEMQRVRMLASGAVKSDNYDAMVKDNSVPISNSNGTGYEVATCEYFKNIIR